MEKTVIGYYDFHIKHIEGNDNFVKFVGDITDDFLKDFFGYSKTNAFNKKYMSQSSLLNFENGLYKLYTLFLTHVELIKEWKNSNDNNKKTFILKHKSKLYAFELHKYYPILEKIIMDNYDEINLKYNILLIDYLFDFIGL